MSDGALRSKLEIFERNLREFSFSRTRAKIKKLRQEKLKGGPDEPRIVAFNEFWHYE